MEIAARRSGTQPLVDQIARRLPGIRVEAYDGSSAGPAGSDIRLSLNTPLAFVRIARAPRGLGLARAWVSGDIDVKGNLQRLVAHESALREPGLIAAAVPALLRATLRAGLAGLRATGRTTVEYRGRVGSHSTASDLREVDFHYGHSVEFFRLLLGPSMTYSGGIFLRPQDTLEDAQDNKHAMVCRKLCLDDQSTLLDVGCGWGGLVEYASRTLGCRSVGVTASASQHRELERLIASGTVADARAEYGDYRQVLPVKGVTAVASVGMYEHVGEARSARFFGLVRGCMEPGGLYLNQAIVRREDGPRRFRRNSFVQRYIFPNGQLLPLSRQLVDLERAGFRVLSVETFGPSYAATLGCWIENLTTHWDAGVSLEGEPLMRAWYMYLAGAKQRFEVGAIDLAQIVARAEGV